MPGREDEYMRQPIEVDEVLVRNESGQDDISVGKADAPSEPELGAAALSKLRPRLAD